MSERKPPPGDDEIDRELDEAPTPEELKGAASLAKLVDRLAEGRPPPPAMRAEDRMLLDAATMIHASYREQALPPKRVNALVDEVLAQKTEGPHSASRMIAFPGKGERRARGAQPAAAADPVDADLRPRRRLRLFVAGAALAAAACVLIAFMALTGSGQRGGSVATASPRLPALIRSRSADGLIGQISKRESGNARERLDLVYADRMRGYREVSFRSASVRSRLESAP